MSLHILSPLLVLVIIFPLKQEAMPPVLRGEMLLDRMGGTQARLSYEQLRKDAQDLEIQINQLQVGTVV